MTVEAIFDGVISLDRKGVPSLVQEALDQGADPEAILNQGLIAALDEVGKRFSEGIMYVPEMLMAAKAMQGGLNVLKPKLKSGDAASQGTVVIGTVKGDLHDIGKNLVTIMLEGAGFAVHDVGVDVEHEAFVQKVQETNADILALSALLTTTMPGMETTIRMLKQACPSVKTIVGGAPVNESFARKVGADGYAGDAPDAVRACRKLLDR